MALVETQYTVPGWGTGGIWFESGVVLAHEFHFETGLGARPPEGEQGPPTDTVASESTRRVNGFVPRSRRSGQETADGLIQRFHAFLAGDAVDFGDIELDLEWTTSFQRSLADTLREVPRGELVSYGELAALAGRPGAARAAGAFCAANRFAFIVPCHRVVAAHGIGGYGSAGLDVKRRLLALDGVAL